MLRDRRVLLEKEIATLRNICSHMYYRKVTVSSTVDDDIEYQENVDKLYQLKTDLELVNQLIQEGHK